MSREYSLFFILAETVSFMCLFFQFSVVKARRCCDGHMDRAVQEQRQGSALHK